MYYVIGGSGFVGSAVCRLLAERGEPFASINRANCVRYAGSRCDVLVNCNGNPRRFWANEHPTEDFEASVSSVMRSLHDFACGLYVYISSVDVYPDPTDPAQNGEDAEIDPGRLCHYGFHKWLAEALVRRYAPEWLILRLGGLVGPGLKKNPVYDALAGQPIRIAPDSELGFIHTRKVAEALYTLATAGHRNRVFNVCGTGTLRIGELAALLGREVAFAADAQERRETYRINNARLRRVMPIPGSRQAVADFVAELTTATVPGVLP